MEAQELHYSPTNTLVFGLGSTGSEYVDRIVSTLRGHNKEKKLPANQCYIVMNTHQVELDSIQNVDPENKITLQKPDLGVLTEVDPDLPQRLRTEGGGSGGAALVRRMGLAYYRNSRITIRTKVVEKAENLMAVSQAKNFQVIIVTAMFGGTGSACLVDLGLDLMHWLKGIHGVTNVSIMAIGILPYKNATKNVSRNALATLKEVSFIRRFEGEGANPNELQYVNPFDFFFVVGTGKSDKGITNVVEWAVTKLLIDLGIIPYREEAGPRRRQLDWANLRNHMSTNKNAFSTFGLYTVGLPIPQLKWVISTHAGILSDWAKLKSVIDSIGSQAENKTSEQGSVEAKISENSSDAEIEAVGKTIFQVGSIEQKIADLKASLKDSLKLQNNLTNDIKNYLETVGEFRKLKEILSKDAGIVSSCGQQIGLRENSLSEITQKIPKEDLQNSIELLRHHKEIMISTKKNLQIPLHTPFSLTIPIAKFDSAFKALKNKIEVLATEKKIEQDSQKKIELIDNMNLQVISKEIGQEEDFRRFIVTPIENRSILSNEHTLLNYTMTPPDKTSELPEEIKQILFDWGRAEKKDGILKLNRSKVGCTVLVTSSVQANLDILQNATEDLREYATELISVDADFSEIKSDLWPHTFNFYALLLGLPLYESDVELPPRLQELKNMRDNYKSMNDEELIDRHAFLFGRPDVFTHLTGIELDGKDMNQRNKIIADFWRNYEIVDSKTGLDQIYVELAKMLSEFENRNRDVRFKTQTISRKCKEPLPAPRVNNVDSVLIFAKDLLKSLKELNTALNKLEKNSAVHLDSMKYVCTGTEVLTKDLSETDLTNLLNATEKTLINLRTCLNALDPASKMVEEVEPWLNHLNTYRGAKALQTLSINYTMQQISENQDEISLLREDIIKSIAKASPNLQKTIPVLANLRATISNKLHRD